MIIINYYKLIIFDYQLLNEISKIMAGNVPFSVNVIFLDSKTGWNANQKKLKSNFGLFIYKNNSAPIGRQALPTFF